MKCDYCGNDADKVTGKEIYPTLFHLHGKTFYRCVPCRAYVGCHPGTDNPLGRLANAELRAAKMYVHRVFDPLWKDGELTRTEAYQRLADKLGIDLRDCHIGMFDIERCREAVRVIVDADSEQGGE